MQLSIYPPPKLLKMALPKIDISDRINIQLKQSHSDIFNAALARFTANLADKIGLQTQITYGQPKDELTLLKLELKKPTQTKSKQEAYQIVTTHAGFLLQATSEAGLFRGLATLTQVIGDGPLLPYLTIDDQPDITERGIMLDISRCKVPSLLTLKRLIDQFSALKYNQLQLYTEHTFAFLNHETVWSQASPYNAADILEIKSYCNERYIELVPNLNCFGHFERWLCHPQYKSYAECPEGFVHPLNGQKIDVGSTLKPNKKSLGLINELHREMLPLFDSDYFNIGGDEPWELGEGWSKARCETQGTTAVYVDFIKEIQKLVEKRGRTMMFWSDIVLKEPSSLKQLSKDLIALNWGYEANHPFKKESEAVASQNIPFYVCPGTSSWNSLTGRIDNTTRNLTSAAKNGIKYGAQGYLVTDWGDHGHHQYLPFSYPGFALGACESWNQRGSSKIELGQMVNQMFMDGQNPRSAELLIKIGQTLELAPSPIRNATIFNHLLFSPLQTETSVTSKISDHQLSACESQLTNIQSELSFLNEPDSIAQAEMENAVSLSIHSIQRLQLARGGQLSRQRMLTNLQTASRRHRKLWLARNRPGGLAESSDYLKRSQKSLSRYKAIN
ncbi:MAG: family 20 glycosylhydrolase [Pseudomonadales bacterium]|jgi:hexosaminidase